MNVSRYKQRLLELEESLSGRIERAVAAGGGPPESRPDPNEVGRVWRPDLGMPCSPHEVVKALLRRGAPADAHKRKGWVAEAQNICQEWSAKYKSLLTSDVVPIRPERVVTPSARLKSVRAAAGA